MDKDKERHLDAMSLGGVFLGSIVISIFVVLLLLIFYVTPALAVRVVSGASGGGGGTGGGGTGPTGAVGGPGPTGAVGGTGSVGQTGGPGAGATGPHGATGGPGATGVPGPNSLGPVINVSTLATSSSGRNYFFAAGDGGWSAAFQAAGAQGIQQIYFPQGTYHMTAPAKINFTTLSGIPGEGLTVWGDGAGSTIFAHDGPIPYNGNWIDIGSSSSMSVLNYVFRDFTVHARCSGYALAFNDSAVWSPSSLNLNGSKVLNLDVNNDCVNLSGLNARGGMLCRNFFSSDISTIFCNVHSNDLANFNLVGGLVLSQVQYCNISAGGLGANKCDDPSQGNGCYLGWGLILNDHCANNSFSIVHVEVAGGGLFFESAYSNAFNSVLLSRILNQQPTGSAVPNDVVAWSSNTGTTPSGHTYGTIFINSFNGDFSDIFPHLGQSACTFGCIDNASPTCHAGFP